MNLECLFFNQRQFLNFSCTQDLHYIFPHRCQLASKKQWRRWTAGGQVRNERWRHGKRGRISSRIYAPVIRVAAVPSSSLKSKSKLDPFRCRHLYSSRCQVIWSTQQMTHWHDATSSRLLSHRMLPGFLLMLRMKYSLFPKLKYFQLRISTELIFGSIDSSSQETSSFGLTYFIIS